MNRRPIASAGAAVPAPAQGHRAVILLHGLGRGPSAMRRMEIGLAKAGWIVANVGYPSLRRPLRHHVERVRNIALKLHNNGAREIALVGHSLGGFIARMAALHAAEDGWTPGRIVLIGSPAQASAIAEALRNLRAFRIITGECGQTLTPPHATQIAVPNAEIAVIAGGNGKNGYNPFLEGDNDGIVTVVETRIPGAETDFLLLRSIHTTLPMGQAAVMATRHFLETGRLLPLSLRD